MRPPKYPWQTWLDGEVHVLRRGEDFTVHPVQMQHYLYTQGRLRHGASICTRRLGDVVLVQGVSEDPADGCFRVLRQAVA